jgi:hypothetical protein
LAASFTGAFGLSPSGTAMVWTPLLSLSTRWGESVCVALDDVRVGEEDMAAALESD